MRKTLTVIILVPLLPVLALAVYLRISDLSELRPYVTRFVSNLIHRPLVVEGAFSVKIGARLTVEAENVRLANPDWASNPSMAEADSLSITFDSRSFFSPPVRFVTSSVRGGRLYLEKNPDGVGNWEFGKKEKKQSAERRPSPVVIEQLELTDVQVVYFDRSRDLPPVRVNLKEGETKRLEDGTYRVENLQAAWQTNSVRIHGIVGKLPGLMGTDLTVEGSGPDVLPLAAFAKIDLPAGAFSLRGRVERLPTGFRFHDFLFESGGYRLSLEGRLGNFPRFDGTDFQMQAKGPSLSVFSRIQGLPELPKGPFEVAGSLHGNPTRFTSDRFKVRLGGSDLRGSFSLDLRKDPPRLSCDLRSGRVDLTWLHSAPAETPEAGMDTKEEKLLISDRPLDFGFLKKMDGRLQWRAGTVLAKLLQTRNVFVDVNLKGGTVQVTRAQGSRGEGEDVRLEFLLEPLESAYHVRAKLRGEKLRLRALGGTEETLPRMDLEFEFDGTGRSLRELALQGRGDIRANVSAGAMKTKLGDLFTRDILKTITNALNPFGKKEKDTKLECAVMVAHLDKGEAKLDALAVQTDTTTIAGDGKILIEKEKLAFEWVAKPRKGVGLSASSLSEPYVKLGGTLSQPKLEIKLLSAGVSTGVAIVTLGLSVVAKGVWNRISAESDVCKGVNERFASAPPSERGSP